MKKYLIYVLIALLVAGAATLIVWRAVNPRWRVAEIVPFTHQTFHGIDFTHPPLVNCGWGVGLFEGETADGQMKIQVVRDDKAQPLTIMINGQSYGQVAEGDRLEIDYGPKVKVNGEERQPQAVENQAATEAVEQ